MEVQRTHSGRPPSAVESVRALCFDRLRARGSAADVRAGRDLCHRSICVSGGGRAVPSVSVLMAVCASDSPAWLDEALRSLHGQNRLPDEVIVVEDGELSMSMDQTLSRYRQRLPLRRVPIRNRTGLGNALAMGMTAARGELVARMDADDACEPERLEVQARCFEDDPDLVVLGSAATLVDERGARVGERRMPITPDEIRARVWTCPFIHPTVMFRREAILKVGNYDAGLPTRQDYDLWFRCVAAGLTMRNLTQPLLRYRLKARPKHRRLSVVWRQTVIGWRGCRRTRAQPMIWVGVAAPLALYFLPMALAETVRNRYRFGTLRSRADGI